MWAPEWPARSCSRLCPSRLSVQGRRRRPCRPRGQSSLPRPVAAGSRPSSCCISSTLVTHPLSSTASAWGAGAGQRLGLVTAALRVVAVSAPSGLGRAGMHRADRLGTVPSATSVSSRSTRVRVRVTGDTVGGEPASIAASQGRETTCTWPCHASSVGIKFPLFLKLTRGCWSPAHRDWWWGVATLSLGLWREAGDLGTHGGRTPHRPSL